MKELWSDYLSSKNLLPALNLYRLHCEGTEQLQVTQLMQVAIQEIERLRSALESAVEVIETWHNMGGNESVWQIYWLNAPEMKPIREALQE